MGKWKGIVLDRRKGMKVKLYDLETDETEQVNVAAKHPEVVQQIRNAMLESHKPSPFWDKGNKPLYNAKAACAVNNATSVPRAAKQQSAK